MLKDQFGRTIDYMRISVTDRCNLRCRYCMPRGIERVPMAEILSYEEIAFVCTQAAALGIDRFRITGGEPLKEDLKMELEKCFDADVIDYLAVIEATLDVP